MLTLSLTACFSVFEDKGTIIGNPDFVPSFQHVTHSTFINLYTSKLASYDHANEYKIHDDKQSWVAIYSVNDKYTLFYDEGYIKFSFKTDQSDQAYDEALTYFYALSETLDPDIDLDNFLSQIEAFKDPEDADVRIPWEDLYFHGPSVTYDFDLIEDEYLIYAHDQRMGH